MADKAPQMLDKNKIAAFLPTLDADKISVTPCTDSTNTQMKQMALQGAENGTVLFAEKQTGGHGRLGRSFFSPPGAGLYFSYLLRTELPPERVIRLTTAVSVALCRAIDRVCGTTMQIKWINDLYLNGRKICGILTDSQLNPATGRFDAIVIGVGINVNTPQEAFPADLQSRAGSLFSIMGKPFNRNQLAAEILCAFHDLPMMLSDSRYLEEYRERSCVLGRRIQVYGAGMDGEEAIAESIDENGFLSVRNDDGRCFLLNSGEITIRPTN